MSAWEWKAKSHKWTDSKSHVEYIIFSTYFPSHRWKTQKTCIYLQLELNVEERSLTYRLYKICDDASCRNIIQFFNANGGHIFRLAWWLACHFIVLLPDGIFTAAIRKHTTFSSKTNELLQESYCCSGGALKTSPPTLFPSPLLRLSIYGYFPSVLWHAFNSIFKLFMQNLMHINAYTSTHFEKSWIKLMVTRVSVKAPRKFRDRNSTRFSGL